MFDNLSLMYVSCNTYKSLWIPFVKLKEKYIGNDIKMYFCIDEFKNETINFNNTCVINFNQKSKFFAGGNLFKRYLYYLQNIPTDYILYFYDDMFPIQKVELNSIKKLINIMEKDKNVKIIKLSLHSAEFSGQTIEIDDIKFVKANNKIDNYIFNTQPILIRRDIFIDIIDYCQLKDNCSHQNGGLELSGTGFFRNTNYTALRVVNDIIHISSSSGIVTSGIIENNMKNFLKEKEGIDIQTYEHNLIFELTIDELNCLGERLKEHYKKLGIL